VRHAGWGKVCVHWLRGQLLLAKVNQRSQSVRKLRTFPKSKKPDPTTWRPSKAQAERMSELYAQAVWAKIKRMAGEG